MKEDLVGIPEGPAAVLAALARSGKHAELRLDEKLEPAGVSFVKWSMLKFLVDVGEPLPLGRVAEGLACVRSNVTQLVDRLEAEQLVSRAPDPDDRRSILLRLTDEGRRRYEVGRRALGTAEQELLAGYTSAERALLLDLLARLVER